MTRKNIERLSLKNVNSESWILLHFSWQYSPFSNIKSIKIIDILWNLGQENKESGKERKLKTHIYFKRKRK